MEKLEFDLEYYKMIQNLIEILKKLEETKIHIIIEEMMEAQKYKREKIEEIISFFITNNFIEVLKQERSFSNFLVKLKKTPEIQLKEKSLMNERINLTLTLPPFNIFGLGSELERKSIEYDTLEESFRALFEAAKNHIFICSPFMDNKGFSLFEGIIREKLQQGIILKILTRIGKKNNNSRMREISRIYEKIKFFKNQVFIYDYLFEKTNRLQSSIHSKIIIVDDQRAYLGSGEIRENSFRKNFELGLILEGEMVSDISTIFEKICSFSQQIYGRDGNETVV